MIDFFFSSFEQIAVLMRNVEIDMKTMQLGLVAPFCASISFCSAFLCHRGYIPTAYLFIC